MKLVSLAAKNFRTLQDIEISFSHDYCTISGPNNAGKSAVFSLLDGLLGAGRYRYFTENEGLIEYSDDKTYWLEGDGEVRINYIFDLYMKDDYSFSLL